MKVIIAGGRNITNADIESIVKDSGFEVTAVLCGCARGVDELGDLWASRKGIEVIRYPANWDEYGKAAGPIRNGAMAKNADALIAIWDGKSRGTKNMIEQARAHGLKVYIHRPVGAG